MTLSKAITAIQTYIYDYLKGDKKLIADNEQLINECAVYVCRGTFSVENAARYVVEFGKQAGE